MTCAKNLEITKERTLNPNFPYNLQLFKYVKSLGNFYFNCHKSFS